MGNLSLIELLSNLATTNLGMLCFKHRPIQFLSEIVGCDTFTAKKKSEITSEMSFQSVLEHCR